MTNFIEFDVYEQYLAEGKLQAEAVGAFRAREQEANQVHAALRAEYQQKIEESVKTGKDATAELDALDAKIMEAERTLSRRKAEYAAARAAKGGQTTTAIDVINAYRSDYMPQVRQAVMEPFNKRMQKARALMLSAVVDLYQAEDDYSDIYEQVKAVSKAAHDSGETDVYYALSKPVNVSDLQQFIYKLVEEINTARESKQLPAGVEYVKGEK